MNCSRGPKGGYTLSVDVGHEQPDIFVEQQPVLHQLPCCFCHRRCAVSIVWAWIAGLQSLLAGRSKWNHGSVVEAALRKLLNERRRLELTRR